jgi:outer membrane protein TolC
MNRICIVTFLCLLGAGCSPFPTDVPDALTTPSAATAETQMEPPASVVRAAPILAQTPLARAMRPALLSGPTLGAGRAAEAVGLASVAEARAAWRPSLTAGVDAGISTASDAAITPAIRLSQRIFDGGAARNRVAAAEVRSAKATAETRSLVSERAFAAIRAWEELYLTHSLADLAQASVERHDEIAEMVALRVAAGAGRNAEVLRVASRRAEAAALLAAANGNVFVAESRLREIFGASLVVGPLPAPPDATRSVAGNPALIALRSEARAARRDRGAVLAARAPAVFLDLAGSAPRDGDPALTAGLRLDYEFGTDGRQGAALASADAVLDQIAAEFTLAERDLERAARDARARQTALVQELIAVRDSVDTARAVLADAESQFDGGRVDVLDLLELGRDVDRTATRAAQVASELRIAGYLTLFISGELLDTFGICIEGCE